MEPVVYNWRINHKGTWSTLHEGEKALMPAPYYALHVSGLVKQDPATITYLRRAEFDYFSTLCGEENKAYPLLRTIVSNLFKVSEPAGRTDRKAHDEEADRIKRENGFDFIQHEQLREALQKGRIGLSRNRLPDETSIEDVQQGDFAVLSGLTDENGIGEKAIRAAKWPCCHWPLA